MSPYSAVYSTFLCRYILATIVFVQYYMCDNIVNIVLVIFIVLIITESRRVIYIISCCRRCYYDNMTLYLTIEGEKQIT